MAKSWLLALDGDDIGRQLELYMLTEDADGLCAFARAFDSLLSRLDSQIAANPAIKVLLRGGDSILLAAPKAEILVVVEQIAAVSAGSGFTFSGGYGPSMREAYLALKMAKATGKNRIVACDWVTLP